MDIFFKNYNSLSALGFIPYIFSILRHKTRPHLVTWSIWFFLGITLAASYFASGAPLPALLVPIIYVIGPFVIALLALKYGEYAYNFFDFACLLGGIAGIVLWMATGEPTLALYLNLFVDFCGSLPTLRKVALDPWSEDVTAWLLFLVANGLNLAAVPKDSLALISYPLYLFLIPVLVTMLMLRRLKKRSV